MVNFISGLKDLLLMHFYLIYPRDYIVFYNIYM